MKTIIAGSRNINNEKILLKAIKQSKFKITEVISGGARGVDTLAEEWAKQKKVKCKVFPAKWDDLDAPNSIIKENSYGKYNARAGIDRNEEMAKYGQALIAIWDGESRGTANMIETAKKHGLEVYVYYFK